MMTVYNIERVVLGLLTAITGCSSDYVHVYLASDDATLQDNDATIVASLYGEGRNVNINYTDSFSNLEDAPTSDAASDFVVEFDPVPSDDLMLRAFVSVGDQSWGGEQSFVPSLGEETRTLPLSSTEETFYNDLQIPDYSTRYPTRMIATLATGTFVAWPSENEINIRLDREDGIYEDAIDVHAENVHVTGGDKAFLLYKDSDDGNYYVMVNAISESSLGTGSVQEIGRGTRAALSPGYNSTYSTIVAIQQDDQSISIWGYSSDWAPVLEIGLGEGGDTLLDIVATKDVLLVVTKIESENTSRVFIQDLSGAGTGSEISVFDDEIVSVAISRNFDEFLFLTKTSDGVLSIMHTGLDGTLYEDETEVVNRDVSGFDSLEWKADLSPCGVIWPQERDSGDGAYDLMISTIDKDGKKGSEEHFLHADPSGSHMFPRATCLEETVAALFVRNKSDQNALRYREYPLQ